MKNIHTLPTDKLSRLYLEDEVFILSEYDYPNVDYAQNQHLYITSDEGIKDGDWSLDIDNEIVKYDENKYNMLFHNICKKIILTTDQDLIKDGVQTIDDEFLEWFIKNPSCEKVEVKNYKWSDYPLDYKIIIPIKAPKKCICFNELEYQECCVDCENIFNKQKRIYSEEDVKKIVQIAQSTKNYGDYKPYTFEECIEQFKKK